MNAQEVVNYARSHGCTYSEALWELDPKTRPQSRQVSPYFARDERLLLVERVKG